MPTIKDPDKVTNDLQRLLLRAVPINKHGNRTLLHLSDLMDVSQWAMRKWINTEKLSPARVKQIVEISKSGEPASPDGRVSRDDFERFIYND
jgi:hypothetical protein